jgi:multicomponent Na+:H+ antiporter subunit G
VVRTIVALLADGLVILGVAIMTISVYGAFRMPDIYTRLHGTSKGVFLGVVSLLLASVVTGQREIIARVVLIGVFLILTTPVSAHAIARAAYLRDERMETPGAVDESGHDLPLQPGDAPPARPGDGL